MELQASQLGERLRLWQRRLEKREAEQHARQAQLESEWRSDQLALRSQYQQLQERESQLQMQLQRLEKLRQAHDAAVFSFEEECRKSESTIAQSEARIDERDVDLRKREKAVDWSNAWQESEKRKLGEQAQELSEQQAEFERKAQQMQQSLRASFERLTAAGKSLDDRYDRIAEIREQVIAMHHESLCLRAETERLWMQLNPGVEYNELTAKGSDPYLQGAVQGLESEEDRRDFRRWYQHHRHELETKANRVLMRKKIGVDQS